MYIVVEEKLNTNAITEKDKQIIYEFLKEANKKGNK